MNELVCDGHVIQNRLRREPSTKNETRITCAFMKLMVEGNTRAPLQLLSDHNHDEVLSLNDSADPLNPGYLVGDVLRDKYPPTQPLHPEHILSTTETPVSPPIVFDILDTSVVCAAALRTVGALDHLE